MITKNIKNIALAVAVGCALTASTTSCSDFLDILPMNDVVLENYWTEKADVASVMNSCYESLESGDALVRMGIWGELRSDNLVAGASVANDINEILKENILSSNPYANWAKLYECINRCNTVCHYAPIVQSIDPNYTEAEMRANVAEATTLRALAYFYLIRTFRDVPYTSQPSIDDTQSFILPATKFDAVLDSLITDLEQVKDDAVRRYQIDMVSGSYYSFPAENSSRITRNAVYALLADLYLWKGDWDKAIRYCDLVIEAKTQQFEELQKRVGDIREIDLIDDIPMILESPTGSGNTCGSTYNSIFGDGNSFESLFELYFTTSSSQPKNTWVSNYYGNDDHLMGYLSANALMLGDVIKNTNNLFKKSDGRFWESCQVSGSSVVIAKYVRSSVSYTTKNATTERDLNLRDERRSVANAPWIFYRLSDMLLIKAEALVERNQEGDLDAAFALVDIVNKRANNLTSTLKKADYISSKQQMANLVLEERQREFMFEGKRWFDLVRRSRRDGNTIYLVSAVQNKFEENANAIKIKLTDMNIIYMPYAKNELKVNPLLQQNPAYANGEDSQFSK
jgi:hypothetical protein